MIRDEAGFLLAAVLWGAGLAAVYDIFRILRRAVKHHSAVTAAEDFLYWIFAGFALFYLLFSMNDGSVRWYAFAGAASGVWMYHISLSPVLVNFLGTGLRYLFIWTGKGLAVCLRTAARPAKNIGRFLKKRAGCLKIKRNTGKRGEEHGRKAAAVAAAEQKDDTGDRSDNGHALRSPAVRDQIPPGEG